MHSTRQTKAAPLPRALWIMMHLECSLQVLLRYKHWYAILFIFVIIDIIIIENIFTNSAQELDDEGSASSNPSLSSNEGSASSKSSDEVVNTPKIDSTKHEKR